MPTSPPDYRVRNMNVLSPRGATFGRFAESPKRLFARNITILNEARWNTIEATDHYLVGLLSIDLLRPIVSYCRLNYWAGEAPDSD